MDVALLQGFEECLNYCHDDLDLLAEYFPEEVNLPLTTDQKSLWNPGDGKQLLAKRKVDCGCETSRRKPHKKRKNPKPIIVPESKHHIYTNRTNWSHKEEVFLVGAVLERFFKVGSLSSKSSNKTGKDSNECWADIKDVYDIAWNNHAIITDIAAPYERSANALARHYKVMKSQLNKQGEEGRTLRDYWNEFQELYNVQNMLLTSPPKKIMKVE